MALVAGFVGFVVLEPPLGVLALLAGGLIEVAELAFWIRFLRRYRVQTGPEGLVGERGVVTEACAPGRRGMASIHGELWRIQEADGQGLEGGAEVAVLAVDGLTLTVTPTGRQGR